MDLEHVSFLYILTGHGTQFIVHCKIEASYNNEEVLPSRNDAITMQSAANFCHFSMEIVLLILVLRWPCFTK